MKVTEDHVRELLDVYGELTEDEMCALLGVEPPNVAFVLRLMLRSSELVMHKPGSLQDRLPTLFALTPAPTVPADAATGLPVVRYR